MKKHFVEGLSNIHAMLAGITTLEERGAAEANWLLLYGEPGYGKSDAIRWWATQTGSVYLRARAGWTRPWFLADLLAALTGPQPRMGRRDTLEAVLLALGTLAAQAQATRGTVALVIDEADHAAHDLTLMETIRDLSDLSGVPVVVVGMAGLYTRFRRHEQIRSRLADAVPFGGLTADDTDTLCRELSDVQIGADLVAQIHLQAAGRIRAVLNAIARVERIAKRQGVALVELRHCQAPDGRPLPLIVDVSAKAPKHARGGAK